MKESLRKVGAAATTALLLAGGAGTTLTAFSTGTAVADEPAPAAEAHETAQKSDLVAPSKVEGTFSFSQGVVTPTETIARNIAAATRYLCASNTGNADALADVDPLDWPVAVHGDVSTAFVATLGDMAEEGSAQIVMGCTCAGNPADGLATANADVLGVKLSYIAHRAGVSDTANTVVFRSSDGYEIALPLSYVRSRFSLLAFDVNNEPLANSLGGVNQLWLGSTAANYFARDVVDIEFQTRDKAPATPGTAEAGDAYDNVPNVCITHGEAA